jgi:hypothetical protein
MSTPEPNGAGDAHFGRRASDRLEYEALVEVMEVLERHVRRLPAESVWHECFVTCHRNFATGAACRMPGDWQVTD